MSDYSNFPRASVPPTLSSGVEWMQQWVMAPFNGTEDDAIIAASATATAEQADTTRHHRQQRLVLSPENENCKDEIAGN